MILSCLALALAAPALLEPQEERAPELEQVRGTRVRLIRPDGFDVSKDFPGFMNARTGASLMVHELPGPFDQVSRAFSDEEEARKRGMKLVGNEPLNQGEADGVLLRIEQDVQGMTAYKWIWVFGDEKESVLVMGTAFEDWGADVHPVLQRSVRSSVWRADQEVDPFADLGYELTDTKGLKYAGRLGDGLVYSQSGSIVNKDGRHRWLMVAPSYDGGKIEDRAAFAERALRSAEGFSEFRISEPRRVTVDGLPGVELTARARFDTAEREMVLYQLVLFREEGYYRALGMARAVGGERSIELFRRIAHSLKEKPQVLEQDEAGGGEGR